MRGFNVQLPKRKWTPQWLAITTMMLLIFTVAFANGTYMGSTIVLTGTLGTTTEDIMMSFYAGTLGIVAANPLQQNNLLQLRPLPRRSRSAGSIGLRGGSYCRRASSARGRFHAT